MSGFCEKIDSLLKRKGVSRRIMLLDLGLNPNSFVNWQKRGTLPTAKTIARISEYFDVPITYFMAESDNSSLDIKKMTKNISYEPVECPFCGSKTVEVTIITSLYFKKAVRVYKNGINYYNNAKILGEPYLEPTIRLTSFDCSSCKEHWVSHMYKLVKDDNGICSFVKNEEADKKGKKKRKKPNTADG